MFTGLVQSVGSVHHIDKTAGDWHIEIETSIDLALVQIGASICCSGCCLTVVKKTASSFFVDVSAESLSKTIIGSTWSVMSRVNIEPSLKVGDEMGGHIVSGHVDAVAEIVSITLEGKSYRLKIAIPQGYAKFIASKGSITVDGVSLTVNEVDDDFFGVNIIPHTWECTTLGDRKAGDKVNLEIDTIARYVARQLEFKD